MIRQQDLGVSVDVTCVECDMRIRFAHLKLRAFNVYPMIDCTSKLILFVSQHDLNFFAKRL